MIPRATLSAVLISCVIFLIDCPNMFLMWKSDRKDLIVMISTIFLSLTFGLANGLFLSIVLSVIRLIYSWSCPKTVVTTCLTPLGHQYLELTPNKGLYFPTVPNIRTTVLKQNRSLPIVINCENFTALDFTAATELFSLVSDFNECGQTVILKNMSSKFKSKWGALNDSDITIPFCTSTNDLERLISGNMVRDKSNHKEEIRNHKEIMPLMGNIKNEFIGDNKM